MGNLFPAPGGSAPKPPKPKKEPKTLSEDEQIEHDYTELQKYRQKLYALENKSGQSIDQLDQKHKQYKERDLLIECKGLLNQLKDYKALNGQRTTGKRIKELLQKIEAVLE
jgi:hypothetical protein